MFEFSLHSRFTYYLLLHRNGRFVFTSYSPFILCVCKIVFIRANQFLVKRNYTPIEMRRTWGQSPKIRNKRPFIFYFIFFPFFQSNQFQQSNIFNIIAFKLVKNEFYSPCLRLLVKWDGQRMADSNPSNALLLYLWWNYGKFSSIPSLANTKSTKNINKKV